MPAAPFTITKPKLLLGEGREEVLFFSAWLAVLGVGDVQVADYGGKARLAAFIRALAVPPTPGFSALASLAVTRDADLDAAAAFASVS
jgi:hypothetical protein